MPKNRIKNMTQQLINQTKEKITETQQLINNYKQELTNKENILTNFLKELNQIEQNLMKKININSPQDSKQNK